MNNVWYKLLASMMLWATFIIIAMSLYAVSNGLGMNDPIPSKVLIKYIDYKLLILQILSAFTLFGMIALWVHKSHQEVIIQKGKSLMDIVLNEWTSILFNFGSLNLAIALVAKSWLYALVAPLWYVFGFVVYPNTKMKQSNDNKQQGLD